jgi:hypothetical protein
VQLRYANNSNYKNDKLIRKEMFVSPEIIKEVQRIIADSEITKEDDREWPEADRCETKENNARVPNPNNQKKPTHYSMALSEVVAPERWKTDHSAGADRPTTPSTSPVRPCRAVDEDRGFRSAPPPCIHNLKPRSLSFSFPPPTVAACAKKTGLEARSWRL